MILEISVSENELNRCDSHHCAINLKLTISGHINCHIYSDIDQALVPQMKNLVHSTNGV